MNYRWERGVGLARKTQNKKKFKQQSAAGSGAATIEAVGGGVVSESSPGMLSKRRFSNRTLSILILLLIPLAYLSFRSIRVYQLRSMAFEASELRNAGKWRTLEPLAVKWGEADPTTSIPQAGVMMGMFRFVQEGKLQMLELMTLSEKEGVISLKVKHFSPDMVAWEEKEKFVEFPWIEKDDKGYYFEGITFAPDQNRLAIYVAMKGKEGKIDEIRFDFERVTPPAK
jgi:hypothetical protein